MKHSAALKIKVDDILALNMNKDGVLWRIVHIMFPKFTIEELGTMYKVKNVDYSSFQKPTKAQLNAYKKRKEKYYES